MIFLPDHLNSVFRAGMHGHEPPVAIKDHLMFVPPDDQKLWDEWVQDLPTQEGFSGTGLDKFGARIPYGLGPHSMRDLRTVLDLTKPKTILEIGFNLGYSSVMWLGLSDCLVTSVDISTKDETLSAANTLQARFPDRFNFISADSKYLLQFIAGRKFDLIFIDGGHHYEDVMADIRTGLELGVRHFVFDDWWPCFGPGVQKAINDSPLTITHLLSNIAVGHRT